MPLEVPEPALVRGTDANLVCSFCSVLDIKNCRIPERLLKDDHAVFVSSRTDMWVKVHHVFVLVQPFPLENEDIRLGNIRRIHTSDRTVEATYRGRTLEF